MTVAYILILFLFDINGVDDYKSKNITASIILKHLLNINNIESLIVLVP